VTVSDGNPLWKVERLRATAFLTGEGSDPGARWKDLLGVDPEQVTARPQIGLKQATGIHENVRVTLTSQPGREDMAYEPAGSPESTTEASKLFHFIGDWDQLKDQFRDRAITAASHLGPVNRLAFGGVLLIPVKDGEAARELLSRLIKCIQIAPSISMVDFFWQVNRPRKSKVVAGLTVNRLLRWSAPELTLHTVMIDAQKIQNVAATVTPTATAVRLEFDINTVTARTEPFAKETIGEMYSELVDLGDEATKSGDID
jgi:hypothetical protein